jgi:hypothetical protein
MITTIRQRLSGFALLAIFALALVALGFAHRMPTPTDTALAAYLQLGGDIGDICGADLDGDGQVDHRECPACHIVSAAIVPEAGLSLRDADVILVATRVAPRENRAVRTVLDPARGLRAPPLA